MLGLIESQESTKDSQCVHNVIDCRYETLFLGNRMLKYTTLLGHPYLVVKWVQDEHEKN
jgi:hypothetical protein